MLAAAEKGVTKYGARPAMHAEWAAVSEAERNQISFLSGMALANKTWGNYATAEKLLREFCGAKGIRLILPVSEEIVIGFVLWLAFTRNVCSDTISNYLAGIRNMHIMAGVECPKLRSEKVDLLLKGKKNWEGAEKRREGKEEEKRKRVTPDVLRLIKARISDSEYSLVDKRMLWAVCTSLFFGAFRGHEILCKWETKFHPAFTLLLGDVKVTGEGEEERLEFRVKVPKESKAGVVTVVDVFKSVPELCPVRAFKNWRREQPPEDKGQPLFRWSCGKPLTAAALNRILKERLKGYIEWAEKWFTTHSFRTGAASWLGMVGAEDSEVKALGRWSSRAFETYMRLPRTSRRGAARRLGGAV
jgi:hypothetical protein